MWALTISIFRSTGPSLAYAMALAERRKDDGNAKRPSNIIVHGMRHRGWNEEPGNSELIHRPGRRVKHEENGGKSWWHM